MRRLLGPVALVLALSAAPALGDPLDFDLDRLGAPTAAVWSELATRQGVALAPADAVRLASEARHRFALFSTQLGLALTSFVLAPPATTGVLGWAVHLETAYASVSPDVIGSGQPGLYAPVVFPFRSRAPSSLLLPALHVRKGLPFGLEVGGRAIYLDRSQLVAAQGEVKWAVNEGWGPLPDVAVRGALTHLFGQRDLDLTVGDLDLLLGRRFGVGGVMSLTPYAAFRLTWVGARTGPVDFAPASVPEGGFPDLRTPAQVLATQAAFPDVKASDHLFFRVNAGLRLVTGAVALAAELSFRPEKTFAGVAGAEGAYPAFLVPSSVSASAQVGLEL